MRFALKYKVTIDGCHHESACACTRIAIPFPFFNYGEAGRDHNISPRLTDGEDGQIRSLIAFSGDVQVCPITGVVVLGFLSLKILRRDHGLVRRVSKVLPRINCILWQIIPTSKQRTGIKVPTLWSRQRMDYKQRYNK